MAETVRREIELEGVDPRELYGPQNAHLEQIVNLHPQLKIVARGSSLRVLGSEAEIGRFSRRMEGLVAYYLKYGHISSQVIDQCFSGRTTDMPEVAAERGCHRLRQQRQHCAGADGEPAAARETLRQERFVVRRGARRFRQDLYGHCVGCTGVERAAGAAYHSDPSGGRGRRKIGLSPGRPERETRSLSATALRCVE